MLPVNDAPVANPDTVTAVEDGGVNNGTAGVDPQGNVITGNILVSGDAGADSISFGGIISNTTVVGGSDADTIIFSSNADLVSYDGGFGTGSIVGGSGADTLVFINAGDLSGGTVRGGAGADSIVFADNIVSGVFGGDAGNDFFSGSLTVGATGVSFWGGSGDDSFRFTDIVSSGAAATAYFWNEAGTDSITFADGISFGFDSTAATDFGSGIVFGIDTDAATYISFGVGQSTNVFGSGDGSTGFFIGASGNTLVSYGFATGVGVTVVFAGGAEATIAGGDFMSSSATGIFSNATGTAAGTGNFGSASTIPTFS